MRIWATLAAFAAAAAATGVALAATGHSVQGSGHVTFGATVESVSVSAQQESADDTATGNAEVNDATAGVRAHVDVNCVNVIGNFAIVSGVVTSSNDPTLVGDEAAFAVQDNGEGAKAPPDLMSIVNFYNVGVGPDCRVLSEYDLVPLQGGNIQVN
jgi:hypothetical protein